MRLLGAARRATGAVPGAGAAVRRARRCVRELVGAAGGALAAAALRARRGSAVAVGRTALAPRLYLGMWGAWVGARLCVWTFHSVRRRALRGALVDVAAALDTIQMDAAVGQAGGSDQAGGEPILQEWWVDFGTLLGIQRANELIHWDNDVDCVLLEPRWDALVPMLEQRLSGKGYHLTLVSAQQGEFPCRDASSYEWLRVSTKLHLLGRGWPAVPLAIVDMYAGKLVSETVQLYNPLLDLSPASLAMPTATFRWHGVQLRLPRDAEQVLERRYGKTWRTPLIHSKGCDTHEESKPYFRALRAVGRLGICI